MKFENASDVDFVQMLCMTSVIGYITSWEWQKWNAQDQKYSWF